MQLTKYEFVKKYCDKADYYAATVSISTRSLVGPILERTFDGKDYDECAYEIIDYFDDIYEAQDGDSKSCAIRAILDEAGWGELEDEKYILTPKGIFTMALITNNLATNIDDPKIQDSWDCFEKSMEELGYIQNSND